MILSFFDTFPRRYLGIVLLPGGVSLAQRASSISADALDYLNRALDIVQQHSVKKRKIDWVVFRGEAISRAEGAQKPIDTYGAIRFALRKLNDGHSYLQLSPELRRAEKVRNDRVAGELQLSKNETGMRPSSPYRERRLPSGSFEEIAGIRLAIIVVPSLLNPDDREMHVYAESLQKVIATLADKKPLGWVVDLRGNGGGNMWPMLAGVGPLAGSGRLGSFIDADGKTTHWFYESEGAGIEMPDGGRRILCWNPAERVRFARPQIVALLIDAGTGSAGESVALSFLGSPVLRSFGQRTSGQTTANQAFPLGDGANLILATAVEADRTGRVHPDGVIPDVELPEERTLAATASTDPSVRVAATWISASAKGPGR